MERRITLHEAWRLQYRGERYLRGLSKSELFARADDLGTVALGHSTEGKIRRNPINEDQYKERLTHVQEELVMRAVDLRQLAMPHVPKPDSPKVKRAHQALAGKSWCDPILVKVGTHEFMTTLFLEGKGRISLAKTYKDPSLGHARADDESQISVYARPMGAPRLMAPERSPNGSRFGSVEINLQATTDFYVYCMAASCDLRMFDDFTTPDSDADACVIVTHPNEFKARMRAAAAAKLPGWKPLDRLINYVDPFFSTDVRELAPHFCKPFRFECQKEYRFVWLPPKPDHAAEPAESDHIYFNLGPLTDCAELICL